MVDLLNISFNLLNNECMGQNSARKDFLHIKSRKLNLDTGLDFHIQRQKQILCFIEEILNIYIL